MYVITIPRFSQQRENGETRLVQPGLQAVKYQKAKDKTEKKKKKRRKIVDRSKKEKQIRTKTKKRKKERKELRMCSSPET